MSFLFVVLILSRILISQVKFSSDAIDEMDVGAHLTPCIQREQLGHGDMIQHDKPTVMSGISKLTMGQRHHSLFPEVQYWKIHLQACFSVFVCTVVVPGYRVRVVYCKPLTEVELGFLKGRHHLSEDVDATIRNRIKTFDQKVYLLLNCKTDEHKKSY
ncbi:hypothetical protein MKX01_040069 [Papaver californicum]|nr:hypothetical protein MKX01_040069 [Papaver californicum]